MIPVAMLVINTRTLLFVFLTSFCLTIARPSLRHIPVIYLMMVAVTAVVRIPESGVNLPVRLINILADTLLTHLALSLLINIYATSIITLKAWCVSSNRVIGKHFTDCALIDDTVHAYRKYRKLLMEGGIGIRTPRQAIRILAVLVESGVIYILMGVSSARCRCKGCHDLTFLLRTSSSLSSFSFTSVGLPYSCPWPNSL